MTQQATDLQRYLILVGVFEIQPGMTEARHRELWIEAVAEWMKLNGRHYQPGDDPGITRRELLEGASNV